MSNVQTMKVCTPAAAEREFTEEDYFPAVDPMTRPVGNRILVQIRQVPKKKSVIVLVDETRKAEAEQTVIAKLIACGPLAFKKRDTGEPWPEGVWAQPGDILRVPKWNADRYFVQNPADKDNDVLFATLNDHEIVAVVTGDHRQLRAWL